MQIWLFCFSILKENVSTFFTLVLIFLMFYWIVNSLSLILISFDEIKSRLLSCITRNGCRLVASFWRNCFHLFTRIISKVIECILRPHVFSFYHYDFNLLCIRFMHRMDGSITSSSRL